MKSDWKHIFAKLFHAAFAVLKCFIFSVVIVSVLPPATVAVPPHLAGPIYADHAAPLREATTRADGYLYRLYHHMF